MKMSLSRIAVGVVAFAGLVASLDVGPASAQQRTRQSQIQCNFNKWVRDWLGNLWDARDLKDKFANTVCHVNTDRDYCKASANFKALVIRQNKSYQNALANEVISAQGPDFGICILCQARELYQTVVRNTDSVQNMCKKIGDLVANRERLKYAYDNYMNCGFKMSQAALTDDAFDDAFWNSGPNSVRHWLSTRIIPDLTSGVADDVIEPAMRDVGARLQGFVNKYPPTSQDQAVLEQSFSSIACTPMALPPCTTSPVQCPG